MGNWNQGYSLYRNTGGATSDNNWVNARLSGGGDINSDAIGSRVFITTNDGRTLMQEVKCGSSLGAGNDRALHFGLGDAEISELRVRWPNGAQDLLHDVPVNQFLRLNYSG